MHSIIIRVYTASFVYILSSWLFLIPAMEAADFKSTISGSGTLLTIEGVINPEASDVGKSINLYNAAAIDQQFYLRNINGWELWQPESEIPSYESRIASSTIHTQITENIDVSRLVGAQIYLGYGIDGNDLLSGKYKLVHTIESPTSLNFSHDFQATQGKEQKEGEGPWDKRLIMAFSDDGLNFSSSGQIIADQANVPDMVINDQGHIYLYFTGWTVGEKQNTSALALSTDSGVSWVFKYIEINGFSPPPVDPDIILLENGTFRLYFTAPNGNVPAIHYADASDGIHFTYGGVVFGKAGEAVIDSTTMKINDTWHMYVLGGGHAISSDGINFTETDSVHFNISGINYIVSNEINTDEGVRLFGFGLGNQDIRSFTSTDGLNWTTDNGQRLVMDSTSSIESAYIKDPSIIKLPDGRYLMVYVTVIP